MNRDERISLFKTPSAQFRGKPFWAWNGKLDEKQLTAQIDCMGKMGFGGYFMHSRTGLETEYLGREWFDLTNKCADYGSKKGLEAWLYDEDRWPSGIAGGMVTGMVTGKADYRAKFLQMERLEGDVVREFVWDENVQAAFFCRIDNIYVTDVRKWKAPEAAGEGETLLVFRSVEARCSDVYNKGTYLDTMNREGTEYFLKLTHEKYRENCGSRLGASIRGIFTDEPHRGPLFSEFSEGNNGWIPYTPALWEEFERRFGYDLRDALPELFLRRPGEKISRAAHDYIECCQELFLENFARPIHDWCSKNNMIFTGHVLHEDSLTAQTVMQGSLMRFYAHMDYPGVDVLACGDECWWIVKQVASVARQLHKEWILSELYGCTGWQMTFEDYKNAGVWQALFGVNLRCPHLSWYTMKGEAKRDFPASIFYQSAWAEDYAYVEDFFSRIHVFLKGGEPACQLLVLCPIESVWSRAYSGAFRGLEAVDEDILRLEKDYVRVFEGLTGAHIDFDYGEESLLSEYGSVEEGRLRVGECSYSKVLAAGMDTIRSTTLELLEKLAEEGGEVIFAGQTPGYVDGLSSSRAAELARRTLVTSLEEAELARSCSSGEEILIQGEGGRYIFTQERREGQERRIMLLNSSRIKGFDQLDICLGKGQSLELWDAASGEQEKPAYEVKEGKIHVKVDFAPGQERLYVVIPEKESAEANVGKCCGQSAAEDKAEESCGQSVAAEANVGEAWGQSVAKDKENRSWVQSGASREAGISAVRVYSMPQEYEYALSEPNVCVLDRVKVTTDRGERIELMEVLKADRALRRLLDIPYRGGDMLQPWYELKHGGERQEPLRMLELEYRIEAACVPQRVWLAVEDLEHIKGIRVNDVSVVMETEGTWVDIAFQKIKIPQGCLREGGNYIVLQYAYCSTCGIEAVYLLGDFGVELADDRMGAYLTRLPGKLWIGDLRSQGLPFYSGRVRYLLPEKWMREIRAETVRVSARHFEGACVKLIGETDSLIAWAPYEAEAEGLKAVELVLTRRNTFGPLHQYPAVCTSYGPDNFLTEGGEWSDAYMLLPQGIMEELKVWAVRNETPMYSSDLPICSGTDVLSQG